MMGEKIGQLDCVRNSLNSWASRLSIIGIRIELLIAQIVRMVEEAGDDFLTVISMHCYSPKVLAGSR